MVYTIDTPLKDMIQFTIIIIIKNKNNCTSVVYYPLFTHKYTHNYYSTGIWVPHIPDMKGIELAEVKSHPVLTYSTHTKGITGNYYKNVFAMYKTDIIILQAPLIL